MSLLKLRAWALVAMLVALQAPVMFADRGATPPKQAKADREIQQLDQSGQDGTIAVIIRADSKKAWASLLSTLRSHHVRIGRVAPLTNAISLTVSSSQLLWLETAPGVAGVSIEAPRSTTPRGGGGVV